MRASYTRETEFALNAVRQACAMVRQIRVDMVEAAFTKEDRSPVTVADFAAQALIGKKLKEIFPSEILVGEEESSALRENSSKAILSRVAFYLNHFATSGSLDQVCQWVDYGKGEPGDRFWTVDPIDGTKGFIRGDHYAVALALIENGEVKVGVLGCPNLKDAQTTDLAGPGTLGFAVRGQGAWWGSLNESTPSWKPMKVSSREKFSEALLLRSFEQKHVDSPRMKSLTEKIGIQTVPVLMDSLTKYLFLAAGHADILLRFPTEGHPYESIWDQAAGVIMVEEAGGKVTDLDGKALNFKTGRLLNANRGVLLSNGHFHAPLLEILREMKEPD